ncbi:MAG: hypothetical protein P8R48_10655 [Planctomycetota bacterium]|nr:hypothetical protein [Planctomycetota bacterium]
MFLVKLTIKVIDEWVDQNVDENSVRVELLKERLAGGNYSLVVGVFDRAEELTAEERFEAEDLDAELAELFEVGDHIYIEL